MAKKKSRSSLQSSAEDLLSAALSQFATKSGKSALKTLILSIPLSSDLISSLPPSLHLSISQSLVSFKKSLQSDVDAEAAAAATATAGSPSRSPLSPPLKRSRRSSKHEHSTDQDERSRSETLDHLRNLHAFAFIAHLMISHPKNIFSPSDLLPSVQLLHDSLVLYELDPALLSQVSGLCESWWKGKLPGRETLISQTLPFLLSRSLSHGKKADVHRVYAFREAFTLFDYVDESIEDMRLLLVRCVIAPVYMKTDEGRRFLAFVVGLNDRLAKEALALIKSQIPFGRKSILEAYADFLFRAWKGSEGSLREEIENGFLQGLIDGAIHASSKSLASSIRRVLGGFIEQRATDGVEKLLFRISEPLLFRSLQVANSNVRQNALHLFLDMFPLEDPDVTKEVKDILLDKQSILLERLLLDDCPVVRAVAVEGSCRILNLFWEVIPSSMITKILAKIVDSLSHDMCNEVRLSTVNGIIYLLDNPQSHEILKVLLPRLGFMFSDPALSVRVAVTDLLLAVRDIRTFQFNKVVGLDTLLSSLANDHPRVAQKITRLLIPSYFPSKMSLKEACIRCIALIKRSPIAGARFCEFALSEGSSSKTLIELLKVSISLALSAKGLNSDQIDGLFAASANICHSLSSEPATKAALREMFSSAKLKCLFAAAASDRAQAAALTIASIVSSDDLAGLHDHCIASITNCSGLADNGERQTLVRVAHKLMLSYGWSDELFAVLTRILQSIAVAFVNKFDLEIPPQEMQYLKKKVNLPVKTSVRLDHVKGKGSPNSGSSKTEEDLSFAAAAAWQIKDLLNTVDMKNGLLRSSYLGIMLSSLKIISQVTIEQCMHWELLDMSAVIAYTAFAMHISLQNVNSNSDNKSNGVQYTCLPPTLTALDNILSHLLRYSEKLFSEPAMGKPHNLSSRSKHGKETAQQSKSKQKEALRSKSNPTKGGDLKADITEAKVMENVVKIATSVLKFIADAATVGFIASNHVRCLKFASAYARHVTSSMERHQHDSSCFKEDSSKDVLAYIKSSFTYAAKLLHSVLMSSSTSSAPPIEAFHLSNDLLDLIASVELYHGSRYASHIVSGAKPWLPVLILGLGSNLLIKASQDEGTSGLGDLFGLCFPLWLTVLGKAELCDFTELSNEQNDQIPMIGTSVFKKLIEAAVILLKKGNPKILDAVGRVLLTGVALGLERADFDVAVGLLHFTSVKMLGKENTSLKELELMSGSFQKIYLSVEKECTDSTISEDGKHILERARELLSSFYMGSG